MERSLNFEGCNYFRQRLVLSTLSSKPVRITKIREHSNEPGLRGSICKGVAKLCYMAMVAEFEAGFIRLLDKLTNGSHIEVNESGRNKY